MTAEALADLLILDRDVNAAATRLAAFRASLAEEVTTGKRTTAAHRDPFAGLRHVAGRTTYETLAAKALSVDATLHRDALLRWVHELLQARIGLDLAVAEAEALGARLPRETRSRAGGRAALSGDPSTSTPGEAASSGETFEEAIAAAFGPRSDDAAMAHAARLAPRVSAVRREARARRFEASRLLGLAHPSSLVLAADPSGASLARAVLDATEPLAEEQRRAARRRSEGAAPLAALLLALDAREGWPAQLGARWVGDVFSGLSLRGPRELSMPTVLGGASFLRGAARWAAAVRSHGVARSLPFALARDPYAPEVHAMGCLFAWALADPILQKRQLGVSKSTVDGQSRALRTSLLVSLRLLAARVLFAAEPSVPRDTFEELTTRVFGAPLPDALRDAWPRLREDDFARLSAAAATPTFAQGLVARFDEDWFRNPRAGAHLAAVAAGPVFAAGADAHVALAAARAFEEALG